MDGLSLVDRIPMLAPFRVRGFRFQWPADLITHCAFEMETIILGWWIYVETGSVQLLTAYGALHFLGTVIAPMVGVIGDRIGQRKLLTGMRVLYTTFSATLLTLASTGHLTPLTMFIVASAMAFVRTSDIGVRTALVTDLVPAGLITSAIGVSRTTSDVARIMGALTGSGLFAVFGISLAYVVIVSFYAIGLLLTIVAAQSPSKGAVPVGPKKVRPSPWRELRAGLSYIWTTPHLLGAMWLAVLVNLTAFPLSNGLMPYIAREIFQVDKTGLGYLVASFATGALIGSLTVGVMAGRIRLGRMMLIASVLWHAVLLVFAQMTTAFGGIILMMCAGFFQSLSMVTLAGMLMRTSAVEYRGRVMGVRMLATYSLPIGLLVLGWMIEPLGFALTASLSAVTGIVLTLVIALYWRAALWPPDGTANQR